MSAKKVIVLSLGGSVIIPDKINYSFLHKFEKTLRKHYKTHKFVIVCGGGSIARKYISALKAEGKSELEKSMAGIMATRENAVFMMEFFGKEANSSLPLNMEQVKNNIHKNSVVFCGALRFMPKSTSDETAARLANFLKTDFINITNVPGLYTSDPRKNKNAKLIKEISWNDFNKIASKIKYHAGEHFVLDQKAASLIKKHKIRTYIIGPNLKNLENILKNNKFLGTLIS